MTDQKKSVSRREFLKTSLVAGMGLAVLKPYDVATRFLQEFPEGKKLGRVLAKLDLKSRPSPDSQTVSTLYDDAIVVWLREVMGDPFPMFPTNRRWIETPEGYLPAPLVQPVNYRPNVPVTEIPSDGGVKGFWAEVTIPYAPFTLVNANPASPHLKETPADRYRLYYSQIYWIDDVMARSNGELIYRAREPHGSYGDVFWAQADAFKQLTADDLKPISPDVDEKRIVIDLTKQTLTCLEGKREVHYCRISSGAKYDAYGVAVDNWSTPIGDHHAINRKFVTLHMAGGSAASGYELMSVSYTSIFASGGVAIHSTYWHNNYGEPMSHGCVNVSPEDAKFIYRWSRPEVPYREGKMEVTGYDNTTQVSVIES